MPPTTRRLCTCTRCAASARELFIAGEQGIVLKLDRDSGRFAALTLPYKGSCSAWPARTAAVLVYGLRGNVVRSTDGGASWTQRRHRRAASA